MSYDKAEESHGNEAQVRDVEILKRFIVKYNTHSSKEAFEYLSQIEASEQVIKIAKKYDADIKNEQSKYIDDQSLKNNIVADTAEQRALIQEYLEDYKSNPDKSRAAADALMKFKSKIKDRPHLSNDKNFIKTVEGITDKLTVKPIKKTTATLSATEDLIFVIRSSGTQNKIPLISDAKLKDLISDALKDIYLVNEPKLSPELEAKKRKTINVQHEVDTLVSKGITPLSERLANEDLFRYRDKVKLKIKELDGQIKEFKSMSDKVTVPVPITNIKGAPREVIKDFKSYEKSQPIEFTATEKLIIVRNLIQNISEENKEKQFKIAINSASKVKDKELAKILKSFQNDPDILKKEKLSQLLEKSYQVYYKFNLDVYKDDIKTEVKYLISGKRPYFLDVAYKELAELKTRSVSLDYGIDKYMTANAVAKIEYAESVTNQKSAKKQREETDFAPGGQQTEKAKQKSRNQKFNMDAPPPDFFFGDAKIDNKEKVKIENPFE